MWQFFIELLQMASVEQNLSQIHVIAVPLQNYISKGGPVLSQITIGDSSALNTILQFISSIHSNALNQNEELLSICSMALLMTVIENVPQLDQLLPDLLEMCFSTLTNCRVPELKSAVIQTISLCFEQYTPQCFQYLEQTQRSETLINTFLEICDKQITSDFEVKRALIGLSSLLRASPDTIPAVVQNYYGQIMRMSVELGKRSFDAQSKMQKGIEGADTRAENLPEDCDDDYEDE